MKFRYSYKVVETNQGTFHEGQRVLINSFNQNYTCCIIKITSYVYQTTFTLDAYPYESFKLQDYKIQKMVSLDDENMLPKVKNKRYMSMIGKNLDRLNVISTYTVIATFQDIYSQWEDVNIKFVNENNKIHKLKIIDIIKYKNDFLFNFIDEEGNLLLNCPESKIESMTHLSDYKMQ